LRAVILEHERRNASTYNDSESHEALEHQKNVARAGSYRAFIAAISYWSWLERRDCVAVAQMMELQPVTVRQILFKLNETARALGFGTFQKAKQRPCAHPRLRLERRRRAIRRRLYGKPEFVEGFHGWDCKIARVDASTNKWRCTRCNELNNKIARERARRNRRAA
jgi:hypothetical protein